MAWIESHQALLNHRKTLRVADRLGIKRVQVIGHLHILWWWGLDNVPNDGHLGDLTDTEIARAADWSGNAETFVDALTYAGFIDSDEHGRRLHDWWVYAGKLNAKKEADRERKSQRIPLEFQRKSPGNPPEVAGTYLTNQQTIPTTPTTPTAEIAAKPTEPPPTAPPSRPEIYSLYENTIGTISGTIADVLREMETEYDPDCIRHAFQDAAIANVRRLKYVQTICIRHKAQGSCIDDRPATSTNGYRASMAATQGASWPGGYDPDRINLDP